jgi:hypothetical protein
MEPINFTSENLMQKAVEVGQVLSRYRDANNINARDIDAVCGIALYLSSALGPANKTSDIEMKELILARLSLDNINIWFEDFVIMVNTFRKEKELTHKEIAVMGTLLASIMGLPHYG